MLISSNFFLMNRVFEFKGCSCILDLTFFGIKKIDSIKKIVEFAKDKCDRHLFDVFYDNSYIVCCIISLEFAAKSDSSLYNDCSRVCQNEAADPNPVIVLTYLSIALKIFVEVV